MLPLFLSWWVALYSDDREEIGANCHANRRSGTAFPAQQHTTTASSTKTRWRTVRLCERFNKPVKAYCLQLPLPRQACKVLARSARFCSLSQVLLSSAGGRGIKV